MIQIAQSKENTILLWIRSFIFNIFFFIMLFHISVFYRFYINKNLKQRVIKWVEIIYKGMKVIIKLDFKSEGKQLDRPAIYASRHESTWETVLFFIIFRACPIVLKKELKQIPIFGGFLTAMDMISVDRNKGTESIKTIIRGSKKTLSSGENIAIFPEGTRRPSGAFYPINTSGLYAMYHASNVPVVPVVLNSGRFWKRRAFIKYPGTITIKYLSPIEPGLDKVEFSRIFNESIKNNLLT